MTDIASPPGSASARLAIIVTCFILVVLDGLDTISITFVAPRLAALWGLHPSAMAPAFLATSLGAVVGYLIAGRVSAQLGERMAMILAAALFGLGTLATAWSGGIVMLSVLRFVTSIGLGAALPVAVAVASSVVAQRHRTSIAMLVALGLSTGGVLAGILGGPLIAAYGWEAVFHVGGVLPLLMIPVILVLIPRRIAAAAPVAGSSLVKALFGPGLALPTVLLWTFAFVIFVNAYALLFWIPTLMQGAGLAPERAPASAAAISMGGLVGGIVMILCVAKWGIARTLIGYALFTIAAVLVFALGQFAPAQLLPLVFGLGLGLLPCLSGQSGISVAIYPPSLRTTGIGYAAAAGRIGSIAGPAVGGIMVGLGWTPQSFVLMTALPTALSLVLLLVIYRVSVSTRTGVAATA